MTRRYTIPLIGPVQLYANDYLDLLEGDIELTSESGSLKFIQTAEDFPPSVGGVRTLENNTTYFITSVVDLLGGRLVCGQNTTIIGGSSENCRIKSTGLVGTALISSAWSLPIRNITIEANVAMSLNANGNPNQAIDWFGVNFTDCPTIGTVANYGNVIFTDCAALSSANLTFDGSINTVGINSSLFSGVAGQSTVIIAPTATIARRFRIIYSAVSTPSTGTGINVSASASIPSEGYILDTCNFSGAGTAIAGVTSTSDKALFVNNVGITNTSANAQMYMVNNATATTVSATNTYYKIAGTTTADADNSKFTHSNNRLTYTGAISRRFLIQPTLSFTSGSNNVCRFGFYTSSSGAVRTGSATTVTANLVSGMTARAEALSFHDVITMNSGDYIEIHGMNTTLSMNITATDLNVTITQM